MPITTDTLETFEEKYAKEISERVSAGLPRADAIAVQKAQIESDVYWEKENARREKEAKAKQKAPQS